MKKGLLLPIALIMSIAISAQESGEDQLSIEGFVNRQMQNYPKSRLLDIYKSCFQDYMGAEHLVSDRQRVKAYFTVMTFDVKDSKVLNYMGTKSGRDDDRSATQGDACPDKKAQALGLHTAYTANGTPYYTEAAMVIECKIMYAAPFDPQYFKSDAPKRMYANFPAGIHSMYIGEVVNAWKK